MLVFVFTILAMDDEEEKALEDVEHIQEADQKVCVIYLGPANKCCHTFLSLFLRSIS